MDDKFMAVFEKLDIVSDEVNVNAVFGEPQTFEGRTLIPVAAVSYGIVAGASAPFMDDEDIEIECECDCCTPEDDTCDCESQEECACDCDMSNSLGGASGGNARPIAVIEITSEGAQVKPIRNEQAIAIAGILLAAWNIGWVGLILKTIFSKRR